MVKGYKWVTLRFRVTVLMASDTYELVGIKLL